MKNIIKLFVLVPMVLLGCVKEQGSNSVKAQLKTTSDGIVIPSEDYLLELYEKNNVTIGLMANANSGNYPTEDNDRRIDMSADAIADIKLVLSGQVFHYYRNQNVCNSGVHLLDLFGKVHDMEITTNRGMAIEETVEYRFYIPELITAKVSNIEETGIERGSILHWNPDTKYPTKVVFSYTLYDDYINGGDAIYSDAFILEDSGILELNQFLTNRDAKFIRFSIFRLNAIEVNTEGKRIALAFTSADHHIYSIKD